METTQAGVKLDNSGAFLPYLWGMETFVNGKATLDVDGSYRTYEEWKLVCRSLRISSYERSYRTYEEWKLVSMYRLLVVPEGSYRTYEEWKQRNTR